MIFVPRFKTYLITIEDSVGSYEMLIAGTVCLVTGMFLIWVSQWYGTNILIVM